LSFLEAFGKAKETTWSNVSSLVVTCFSSALTMTVNGFSCGDVSWFTRTSDFGAVCAGAPPQPESGHADDLRTPESRVK